MAKNNNSNYERWAKRRTTPSLISFSTYWTPVVTKSRLLGKLPPGIPSRLVDKVSAARKELLRRGALT